MTGKVMLTTQEYFDKTVRHLLTQNKQARGVKSAAFEFSSCAYRNEYGLKCAIGCHIPDDLYHSMLEGKPIRFLIEDRLSKAAELQALVEPLQPILAPGNVYPKIVTDSDQFLTDATLNGQLQTVHDTYDPDEWPAELREVAAKFQLNTNVIDETEQSNENRS